MPISQDHVTAINLVEVDFHGDKAVEKSWKSYKNHLVPGGDTKEWFDEKERLLADLLYQMSKKLGFNIDALEIFKGGYAPQGWVHRDERQTGAIEFAYQLWQKQTTLPVSFVGGGLAPGPVPPPPPPSTTSQKL
nr:DUF6680 family protein [Lichenihabitans psoromatis]